MRPIVDYGTVDQGHVPGRLPAIAAVDVTEDVQLMPERSVPSQALKSSTAASERPSKSPEWIRMSPEGRIIPP